MKEVKNDQEVKPGYGLFLNHTVSQLAASAFLYVQHAGHHFFLKGSLFCERKDFRSILVAFTLGGKGYLNYRGKDYEITRGQLMLINCCDYHIMRSDIEAGWHYKWVHFHGCSAEAYFNMIYEKFGPLMDFSYDTFIVQCLDSLVETVQNADINSEIKAANLLNSILTHIFTYGNSCGAKNILEYRMQAVMDYIKRNHGSKISSRDLVEVACYSKCYLFKMFRAFTGYHPHEYIIKFRISMAKSLLKSSAESIEEIAHNVGFESVSNFICTFKRLEGMTPLKFRKMQIV